MNVSKLHLLAFTPDCLNAWSCLWFQSWSVSQTISLSGTQWPGNSLARRLTKLYCGDNSWELCLSGTDPRRVKFIWRGSKFFWKLAWNCEPSQNLRAIISFPHVVTKYKVCFFTLRQLTLHLDSLCPYIPLTAIWLKIRATMGYSLQSSAAQIMAKGNKTQQHNVYCIPACSIYALRYYGEQTNIRM